MDIKINLNYNLLLIMSRGLHLLMKRDEQLKYVQDSEEKLNFHQRKPVTDHSLHRIEKYVSFFVAFMPYFMEEDCLSGMQSEFRREHWKLAQEPPDSF